MTAVDCDEERLEDIAIGDDVHEAWEFFDTNDAGQVTGPSDLSAHTFRSHIRYDPDDPAFYPFTISVVDNLVHFIMLSAVSENLPVGDLYWDLEQTVGGMRNIIKGGRVRTHKRVTQ